MFYVDRAIVVIHCRPVVKRLLVFLPVSHVSAATCTTCCDYSSVCVQDVTVTVIDATTVKLAFQPQPGATATDIVLTVATSMQDATTVSNLQIYLSTYQSIYLNICLDTEVVEALTCASAPSKRRTTTDRMHRLTKDVKNIIRKFVRIKFAF